MLTGYDNGVIYGTRFEFFQRLEYTSPEPLRLLLIGKESG